MISAKKANYGINNVDNGIVKYIQEINNLGYKTVLSCSGMKMDHIKNKNCPFICFERPHLSGEEILRFLRFIRDCLYNSNWDVKFISRYVIGYLPGGLDDTEIKERFQKLVSILKRMIFLRYNYLPQLLYNL